MQLLMNIYVYRVETTLLAKFQGVHMLYWNIEVENGDIIDIYVEDSSHFPRLFFNFMAGKYRNGYALSIENTHWYDTWHNHPIIPPKLACCRSLLYQVPVQFHILYLRNGTYLELQTTIF